MKKIAWYIPFIISMLFISSFSIYVFYYFMVEKFYISISNHADSEFLLTVFEVDGIVLFNNTIIENMRVSHKSRRMIRLPHNPERIFIFQVSENDKPYFVAKDEIMESGDRRIVRHRNGFFTILIISRNEDGNIYVKYSTDL